MRGSSETGSDSDLLESLLYDFVIAQGARRAPQSGGNGLAPWLDRLPQHLHDDFIECVALAEGMQATQDLPPGEKVRLRRMLRAPVASPCAEVDPKFVGRYEIQYVIARRAGSTVYLAFDPELQRFVAIKILPQSQDDRAIQRFEREARILAGLDHADIVKVYDSGSEGGRPFLALEYVEGRDLSDLETPSTDIERRQEIENASRLAGALAWLHKKGICHRDIKPSNVLLRPDGRVALADFGLAKAFDEESSLTGKLLGTPAYMAPEQVRDPSSAGPSADVYSLACLIAERMSGLSPHLDSPFTQILRNLDEGRPPLRPDHFAKIPKPLIPTLQACLATDPRVRPCAADLKRDLDAWLADKPPRLGNRTLAARAVHEVHTRRRFIAGLGIAGLGVGGLALVIRSFLQGTDRVSAVGAFDEAGSLLFDTGDLPSVLEPVYEMEEGYSPLAMLFLEPVRGNWEKDRLARCESLMSQSTLSIERSRLLDTCCAFRRGRLDRIPALLAEPFPGRAGLEIEYLRRRPAGGKALARQRIDDALESMVIDEADPLDAFFVALSLMALWEDELGNFSIYRQLPLKAPRVESMRPLIARARLMGGAWRGWTELLATGLTRIGCPEVGEGTNPLHAKDYLPGSFWANYAAAGLIIDGSANSKAYANSWSNLHQRFPEATMVRTLLDYWAYPLHPPSWQRSLERLFYQERRPSLAARWIGCAFANGHFDSKNPDGVEMLVRSWLADHPKSKDLLLYVAAQYLVQEQPLPRSVRDLMVKSGCSIPQDDPEIMKVLDRTKPLTVRRIPGDPPLLEMQKQLGLLVAVQAHPGSHEVVWIDVRTSLESLLSARQSALTTLVYRAARVVMDLGEGMGAHYHAIVSWHRLLCPILETQAPADIALARALQGLGVLGPVPLLQRSLHSQVQEILGITELWTKEQEALARIKLSESLHLARGLPGSDRAARESLAGVAFVVAHLASQLSDSEALAEASTLWTTAILPFGLPAKQRQLSTIFL